MEAIRQIQYRFTLAFMVLVMAACGGGGWSGGGSIRGSNPAGITWEDVTGSSVRAQPNTGYMANSASQVAVTLPLSAAIGDVVRVSGGGTGGWKIVQNAGQSIRANSLVVQAGSFWPTRASAGSWQSVVSSVEGLAASVQTTAGITGGISGDQYEALELQYLGGGIFSVLSSSGILDVR